MRDRERERERGRCLYCNRRVWRRMAARGRCLCASHCYNLTLIGYFCSLWAVVVFPKFGFSTLTSVYSSLAYFTFRFFVCIIGSLGCGRAKRRESNPITFFFGTVNHLFEYGALDGSRIPIATFSLSKSMTFGICTRGIGIGFRFHGVMKIFGNGVKNT